MHPMYMYHIYTVFHLSALQFEEEFEQIISLTPFLMYKSTFRHRFIISYVENYPLIFLRYRIIKGLGGMEWKDRAMMNWG